MSSHQLPATVFPDVPAHSHHGPPQESQQRGCHFDLFLPAPVYPPSLLLTLLAGLPIALVCKICYNTEMFLRLTKGLNFLFIKSLNDNSWASQTMAVCTEAGAKPVFASLKDILAEGSGMGPHTWRDRKIPCLLPCFCQV